MLPLEESRRQHTNLATRTIGVSKDKRVHVLSQMQKYIPHISIIPESHPRKLNKPIDTFDTDWDASQRSRSRNLWIQWLIDTRVDRPQRGLFGHQYGVCPEANQGACTLRFCRNNNLKPVSEYAEEVNKTPGS